MDNFTVVSLANWPINDSEARVDLVLIETSLVFLSKQGQTQPHYHS